MLSPARILRRIWSLVTRDRRNRELDEELRFHLEMETAKLIRAGHDPATARQEATRSFGGVEQHREAAHDMRGTRALEDFVQDVRFAFRAIRQQRVFASVSVLTLAVGIGATTAIFGAVYGVLLAPLPYANSDRIVTVWQTLREGNGARDDVPPGVFLDWRERARSFVSMASAEPFGVDMVTSRGPETLETALISENYFETLGAKPLMGRTFRPAEFVEGRGNVVLLSERVWRNTFGADSTLVGRTLTLDSVPTVVVGIMPEAVDLPYGQVAWMPKVLRPGEREERTDAYTTVVARLRDNVALETAAREMDALTLQLAREHSGVAAAAKRGTLVVPLNEVLFADSRKSLFLLLGAVGFVLLIACANVANLQLANGVRRKRELAIRVALGAGRKRLMRQLFAESMVLAGVGGVASVAIAYGGINAIRLLAPLDLPRIDALRLNLPMLIFSVLISVGTAIVFGVLPMLQAGRAEISDAIVTSGSRSHGASTSRRRVQRGLVAAEMVLSMVLLVGAGLLVRSFETLLSRIAGFETRGVTNVTLQAWGYYPTGESRVAYVREAVRRLEAIPGVDAAGMTSSLPLSPPIGMSRTQFTAEGQPPVAPNERPSVHIAAVTGGYFNAMRIPVISGRVFEYGDVNGSMPVVLVNESFAKRYWRGGDPVGKHLTIGYGGKPVERTVVGVVGDTRHEGLASDPEPMVFFPHAQAPTGAVQLVVRSKQPVESMQRAVRNELTALNGSMPLSEVTSLDARLSLTLRERRFNLALMSAFSITALMLAAIGIYGMMTHLTSERTTEIGVRIAIGAEPRRVLWMVMRQSVLLAAASMLVGAAVSLGAARFMQSMLYGIGAFDWTTYLISGTLLFVIAQLAAWVPARRASAIDPLTVIRGQ